MAAQRQSPYIDLARVALTAAAALALTRVFSQRAWLVPVLVAAIVPAAVFAICERRRWHAVVAFIATAVLGIWLAVAVDAPSSLTAALPTGEAWSSFARDFGNAPHVLRSATIPVPPVGAALVLAVVATLVASLTTEIIARYLDAPIGAIGPSIALYVSVSALGSGSWVATAAVYALAVITYVLTLQHSDQVARRTWFQTERPHRSHMLAGGLAVGALVVALAVALGPAVPGARGSALLNYRSLGSGSGKSALKAESPLVNIRKKLDSPLSDREVFSVATSDQRGYRWRLIALDKFKNDDWIVDTKQRSASHLPGPERVPGSSIVHQDFTLRDIDPLWLPAAYRAVRVNADGASVLPESTSLLIQDRQLDNLRYSVDSEIVNPDPSVLEKVTFADVEGKHDLYTELPDNFSPRARALAIELTRGIDSPFERAAAIEKFFHGNGFQYTLDVDLGTSTHALDTFLFDKENGRRGFCEQYAAAFAELARAADLPTRIAVGYQRGHFSSTDGRWHVAERDAHAWPEVWLGETVGWYSFEPTPGVVDPVTGRGGGNGGTGPTGSTTTTPTTDASRTTTPNSRVSTPTTVPTDNRVNVGNTDQTTRHTTNPAARVFAVIGVLAAVALLVALVGTVTLWVRAARRTRRRRHHPDTRRRVLGAWTEALERLAVCGIERRPSATSMEFALRQAPAQGAGDAGPALMDLARLHTAAMYSPEAPSTDDADAAWRHVDEIDVAVKTKTTRSKRWTSRLRRERRRVLTKI